MVSNFGFKFTLRRYNEAGRYTVSAVQKEADAMLAAMTMVWWCPSTLSNPR